MTKQTNLAPSLISKLVNTEIPDIPDAMKWLERPFLIVFTIVFSIAFVRAYPGMFLGFGIGDEFEIDFITSLFQQLKSQNITLFYASIALLIFNVLFRMQVFLRGQLAYRSNHPDLPMKTIMLFMTANTLNIAFVFITALVLAVIGQQFGYSFQDGFNIVQNQVEYALYIADKVPTIIELPLLLAFFVAYTVQGFFHYWFHRFSHMNRFVWLTIHRFHHMPATLTLSTTTVVVTSVPFFLGMIFVKTFIFAALSKLFFERQLFMEIFFYHIVMWTTEAYAHQTALFKEGAKSKFVRILSFISSTGIYHYLHHSRDPEIITSNKTNQVNIGGGICYLWDHMFGTFQHLPAENKPTPKVGLWGNPALHHNPIRILLSGLMQIIYEVYHNKGIKNKVMCILGSVDYTPPITKDFHISEEKQNNEVTTKQNKRKTSGVEI